MKLTTFILILMNPYLTACAFAECDFVCCIHFAPSSDGFSCRQNGDPITWVGESFARALSSLAVAFGEEESHEDRF